MKIAIDISQTAHSNTGVARYMTNLIKALCDKDAKNEYLFFYSSLRKKIDNYLKEIILKSGNKLVVKNIPPTILSFLWNDLHFPKAEDIIGKVDLLITSDWTEPPSNIAKMTIVHDLVFQHYPETVHKTILKTMQKRMRWVSLESDLIISDSNSTKRDLIKKYNIDPKRIMTIYPYLDLTSPKPTDIKTLRRKYNLNSDYILTVGKLEPRKNLKRLIEAFLKVSKKDSLELIIVGQEGWNFKQIKHNNIKFLGTVPEADLFGLYKNAKCFLYPSLYEGFGYPIIEAMYFNCPVATSNISSLKEIGNSYALLFNPKSTSSIQDAIRTLVYNKQINLHYSKKGKERIKSFTKENYLILFNQAIIKAYENWNRRK